ncbi:MAG: PAS domain S-box protein [Bacteroidetes bacterium]|nr:PAS domain S-box protein [Bacteroidota bacterium]
MAVIGCKIEISSPEKYGKMTSIAVGEGFNLTHENPEALLIITDIWTGTLQETLGIPVRKLVWASAASDHTEIAIVSEKASDSEIRQVLRRLRRELGLEVEVHRLQNELVISRKQEEKFRKTLQSTPDAIVIVDGKGVITFVNDQTEVLFGYPPSELVGQTMEILIPEHHRPHHPAHREGFMNHPKARPMGGGLDLQCRRKDGTNLTVEVSLSPVMTETGLQVASAIRDVTPRKMAEEDLKRARDEAQNANKAKSEFLANMSHELRTPLNAILGYSQILEKDKTLLTSQREGLEIIRRSGEHLLTLINDILDLSKIESGHMELHRFDFDFIDFLESIAEVARLRSREKGIAFIFEKLSDLPAAVHSDEKKLRQILFNLLSNAVKFTDEGGVAFKVGYHEGKIRFQIEDTGVGIAPEKVAELFLPFHQVGDKARHVEGTGLGLAISQRLARMLESEVKIKSVPGEGSIFWFELDLIEVEGFIATPKVNERSVIGYSGERKRVLIVDDKWENRSVLVKMLTPLGFEIMEAKDGFECLNKVVNFKPHVILLDLRMPEMDGFEVARRVRDTRRKSETVIIAVSASVFEHNREDSVRSGCDDFIAKPFQLSRILGLLQNHLSISWIYENDGENEQTQIELPADHSFIVISEKFSDAIYQAALMGDVEELLIIADRMEIEDKGNFLASKMIRKWVKAFEISRITKVAQEKGFFYDE